MSADAAAADAAGQKINADPEYLGKLADAGRPVLRGIRASDAAVARRRARHADYSIIEIHPTLISTLGVDSSIEHMYDHLMEVLSDDVEDLVAEVAGHLNAQHARLVRITAAAERDGSWFGVGFLSITHWLTLRAGVAPGRAKQIVTIARRVDELPGADGGIRTRRAVARSGLRGGRQGSGVGRPAGHRVRARGDGPPTAANDPRRELRRRSRSTRAGGHAQSSRLAWLGRTRRLQLSGSVDTEQGTVVDAALGEARDALFHAGHTDVTWADALAEIARRSLAGVAGST